MQYDKQFIIKAINEGYTRIQIAQKLSIAPLYFDPILH